MSTQLQQQRAAEKPAAASAAEGGKGSGGWFGSDNSSRQEVAALRDENRKLSELAARRGQVTHSAISTQLPGLHHHKHE